MLNQYEALLDVIRSYKKVGVCLSGGSGSALVTIAAVEALGKENVVAITANTPFFTGEEMDSSRDLAARLGIKLFAPKPSLLDDADVVANDENRCYFCKRAIITSIKRAAADAEFDILLDGSTFKDELGEKALNEYGIICPLKIAGIDKDGVAAIMKEKGMNYFLPPENACLATRIALGEPITLKKLRWVRAAENYLHSLGYSLVRVRLKDGHARVEVKKEDVQSLLAQQGEVEEELLAMGFKSVTIDPEGYKRGYASCL